MKKVPAKKWSKKVTETSHALALEEGVFTWKDPKKIAKSLQKSALESLERKGTPYQSAMSMLNFYINRAGKKLSKEQKVILEKAKDELKVIFKHKE
jgi:Protein of unknown function (DUF3175)